MTHVVLIHFNLKTQQLARPPTVYELLEKTKKLKSGEWANDKVKNIYVSIKRKPYLQN